MQTAYRIENEFTHHARCVTSGPTSPINHFDDPDEARQARKTAEIVEAARRDIEFQRRADRVQFEETLMLLQKRYNGLLVASAEYGGRP